MLPFKLESNVISLVLAVNITFTTITFTQNEFGQPQYNVESDTGMTYSDELEGYNNQEIPTDYLVNRNNYTILQIKNCLSSKSNIDDLIQN